VWRDVGMNVLYTCTCCMCTRRDEKRRFIFVGCHSLGSMAAWQQHDSLTAAHCTLYDCTTATGTGNDTQTHRRPASSLHQQLSISLCHLISSPFPFFSSSITSILFVVDVLIPRTAVHRTRRHASNLFPPVCLTPTLLPPNSVK
jgi:hypothetical protein